MVHGFFRCVRSRFWLAAGIVCAAAALAPAYAGLQKVGSFSFPTGIVSQQIGYNRPSNLLVAHNGAFAFKFGRPDHVGLSDLQRPAHRYPEFQ
jgi:hypothetical protein